MLQSLPTVRSWLAVLAGVLFLLGCGGSDPVPVGDGPAAPGVGADLMQDAPPRSMAGMSEDELPGPDEAIARVNDAEIQAREMFELAQSNRKRVEASGQTLNEVAERTLLQLSLELLIDNELLVQDAAAKGIELEPGTLDTAFQEIQDQAGTAERFREQLSQLGVTEEELRSELARNLLVQQYTDRIAASAAATEEEARAFFTENPKMFEEGEQARVSQILIRSSINDPEEKRASDRARIEEIHARLVAGEDFAELAKEHSQTTNATKGGDVGFFPRGVMVPAFEEMAFNTPVGELSPVFETPYGFNIILVTDKRAAKPLPFEEVKPTLMLELSRRKGSDAVQSYVAGLRESADVEILVPELFEEPEAQPDTAEGPAE